MSDIKIDRAQKLLDMLTEKPVSQTAMFHYEAEAVAVAHLIAGDFLAERERAEKAEARVKELEKMLEGDTRPVRVKRVERTPFGYEEDSHD